MGDFTVRIEGGDVSFPQRKGDRTLLRAALGAGVGFPYECSSGGCGSCRFELLAGEVGMLWPLAPGLTDRDRRRNKYLACQGRARSDLLIKVGTAEEYRPKVAPRTFRARFVEAQTVTHDIREFRFTGDGPAEFLPGQYALVHFPGVEGARAYSMSNIANSRGEWHFQIRGVPHGQASAHLFGRMKPEDVLEMEGPFGLAYLRTESPRDIVCVAGGSGLSPMVSIARGAAETGMLEMRRLHFFYGGRTPRDICGESFLQTLPGYGERIYYYSVISMPQENPASNWIGEVGYVHELVRRILADRIKDFEFYFAGPPPMAQAVQEMLMVGYRVPFKQIHYDRFF